MGWAMKLLALILFGLLPTSSFAANRFLTNIENTTVLNPSCPVTLTGLYASHPRGNSAKVSVHFLNQTRKKIVAIKVGLSGYDATRDSYDFPQQYAIAVNLKPHKQTKPIWKVHSPQFGMETASGATVYITKLLFSDGSVWKDDGSKACSLTILGEAKPDHHQDE